MHCSWWRLHLFRQWWRLNGEDFLLIGWLCFFLFFLDPEHQKWVECTQRKANYSSTHSRPVCVHVCVIARKWERESVCVCVCVSVCALRPYECVGWKEISTRRQYNQRSYDSKQEPQSVRYGRRRRDLRRVIARRWSCSQRRWTALSLPPSLTSAL